MDIRILQTPDEIRAAFPVMAQLRDRIREETFVSEVSTQQQGGYVLIAAFEDERIVALAGFRESHTLSRGPHLFVDDLITDEPHRGRGLGTALLRWLADYARERNLPRIHLDSRATACGFYEQLGFELSTSVPCSIETHKLAR